MNKCTDIWRGRLSLSSVVYMLNIRNVRLSFTQKKPDGCLHFDKIDTIQTFPLGGTELFAGSSPLVHPLRAGYAAIIYCEFKLHDDVLRADSTF